MEDNVTELPQKSKFAPKGIDHRKSIELRAKGLSLPQIAKIQGCTHKNILDALRRYGIEKIDTDAYKDNRADIFAGLQGKILSEHLTEARIKAMPPAIAPLWFNSLFNNERLERNQSTGNLSVIEKKISDIQSLEQAE